MSKKPKLELTLADGQEIERLIDSREWWVFVGNDEVYEEIESRFYADSFRDHSFLTVMGPPPQQFAAMDRGILMLHFGRKDKLTVAQLEHGGSEARHDDRRVGPLTFGGRR